MNASVVYNLHWKSVPMGAIECFEQWYDPYLGSSVYMLVLATTDGGYVGFYVGKSVDIGRRWREHVRQWFVDPHEGYWLPEDADVFLKDPREAINARTFAPRLPNRSDIARRILHETWFCFAEVDTTQQGHSST